MNDWVLMFNHVLNIKNVELHWNNIKCKNIVFLDKSVHKINELLSKDVSFGRDAGAASLGLEPAAFSFRLQDNEQRAEVLQQEREYYSSQARVLQQSLSQLSVDKLQTEAELKVAPHDSAALAALTRLKKVQILLS